MATLPVNDALLRSCCLHVIERSAGPEEEGSVLFCNTCTNRMRVHGGIWVFYPHVDTATPPGGRNEELSWRWNRDQTAR